MTLDDSLVEEENERLPATETHVLSDKNNFADLTGIKPLEEQQSHRELITEIIQVADEMLKPYETAGLILETESEQIRQTWKNAIFLDNKGMSELGKYSAAIYQKAVEDLSELDKEGRDPQIQDLIQKAKSISVLHIKTAQGAAVLTYRPNPLKPNDTDLKNFPSTYFIINTEKLKLDDKVTVRCVAYEETAHMMSKLSQYPSVNSKWLEEAMARYVAFGTQEAHPNYNVEDQEKAAKLLRLDDYSVLIDIVNHNIGDNGETLTLMFFGREPLNSLMVAKTEKSVKEIELIGNIVDAGVSINQLLEMQSLINNSENN